MARGYGQKEEVGKREGIVAHGEGGGIKAPRMLTGGGRSSCYVYGAGPALIRMTDWAGLAR